MVLVVFFLFLFLLFFYIGMCWFMYLVGLHFGGGWVGNGQWWSLLCSARQTDRDRERQREREKERDQRRNKNKFVYSMCFAWLLRSRGILYQTSRSPPTLTLPKHKQQEEKKHIGLYIQKDV